MANIKSSVFSIKNRPSRELLKKFESVVTPHVSDNMDRIFGFSSSLRPFHNGKKLIGTAFTVKTRPGDNLLVHKALDIAEPGDVLVIDAAGDTTNAILGEMMMNIAIKNGLAGFVIDGSFRDSHAFIESNFPVYAKGVTHLGPFKDGPGEINVPVSIGGMVVSPGDIILGDEDGVVSIPLNRATDILNSVNETVVAEEKMASEIQAGTLNRDWIDETLRKNGCVFY